MKNLYLSLILIGQFSLVNAQTTTRLPLVEGLTSNTCGPCASWNGFYGPIIENNSPNDLYNPGIAVVKYQMNWPSPDNDPSYNADGNMRKGYYGTTGIPDWYIDGQANDGTQTMIDAEKLDPADLKITASYTLTGNQIDVTVEIIPLINLGSGNRCYIALTNKTYNYSGGTNGESTFHHVMRKMLPDGAGSFLSSLIANDTTYITQSYTYSVAGGVPAQESFDFWNSNFEVVCWVQKSTTKAVQNATIAPEGALAIEENETDDFALMVFPNPANEKSTVVFDGNMNEDSKISIYNQLGEIVFEQNYGKLNGRQRIELNTTDFSDGIYFVQVTTGSDTATKQMMVVR